MSTRIRIRRIDVARNNVTVEVRRKDSEPRTYDMHIGDDLELLTNEEVEDAQSWT